MILYKICKYFINNKPHNLVRCSFVNNSHIISPKYYNIDMNICSKACSKCNLFIKVLDRSIMWCKHKGVYRLEFDENK